MELVVEGVPGNPAKSDPPRKMGPDEESSYKKRRGKRLRRRSKSTRGKLGKDCQFKALPRIFTSVKKGNNKVTSKHTLGRTRAGKEFHEGMKKERGSPQRQDGYLINKRVRAESKGKVIYMTSHRKSS